MRSVEIRLGRFLTPLGVTLLILIGSGLLRVAFGLSAAELRKASLSEWAQAVFVGIRFDLLVGLSFMLPQALLLGLGSNRLFARRQVRFLLQAAWCGGLVFLLLLWVAEWLFFDEFQTRLNYIAFEYLVYPTEVCCNIWQSYHVVPLALAAVGAAGGLFAVIRQPFLRSLDVPLSGTRRCLLLLLYLASAAGLWSTLSMADMEISSNRLLNECAGNGLYSFVYYAWTCRLDFDQSYMTIDDQAAYRTVRARIFGPDDEWHASPQSPLDRTVHTGKERRDYNVVLILEESFGADFIGTLGEARGLTPEFDELSKQGLLFDNFYATGNRTARALEAVLASLPPLPSESILKRDHSSHVYTLANVLAARGYQRLFMTAGRGVFDGVRSFMTANGFDQFLEQSDFENPAFTNAWGVSDEDLFARAIKELDRLHATGRPFFSLLLTVSNHRPFTFPPGRVADDTPSRLNVVRYADWALGTFFREARSHEFFDKTIFIVMGDHGARVYGSQLFPMKSYRVPVLILHPETPRAGQRCQTLGCSMDIAPTVMGLLGGSYRSTFFGRDLLMLRPEQGYALLQHNHDAALLGAENEVIVLGARRRAGHFRLDRASGGLTSLGMPSAPLLGEAIAFYQAAYRMYYGEHCYPAE